jgi:hypothetical protein
MAGLRVFRQPAPWLQTGSKVLTPLAIRRESHPTGKDTSSDWTRGVNSVIIEGKENLVIVNIDREGKPMTAELRQSIKTLAQQLTQLEEYL